MTDTRLTARTPRNSLSLVGIVEEMEAVTLKSDAVSQAADEMRGMSPEARGALIGRLQAEAEEARKAGASVERLLAVAMTAVKVLT